jgi:hypothetical protein
VHLPHSIRNGIFKAAGRYQGEHRATPKRSVGPKKFPAEKFPAKAGEKLIVRASRCLSAGHPVRSKVRRWNRIASRFVMQVREVLEVYHADLPVGRFPFRRLVRIRQLNKFDASSAHPAV